MKSIGIFWGTFNPIHNGHINLVNEVSAHLNLDRIIVMPTKVPPHKQVSNLASEENRLEMCRLAFEGNPKAEVSDYEIKQEGKSFTVLTLRHFRERFPETKLSFIMGSDMLLSFHTWYLYEEILSLASIVAVARNSKDIDKISDYSKRIESRGGECTVISIEPYEISSTQIRNNISSGEDYACYLPEKVVKYIRSENLYV